MIFGGRIRLVASAIKMMAATTVTMPTRHIHRFSRSRASSRSITTSRGGWSIARSSSPSIGKTPQIHGTDLVFQGFGGGDQLLRAVTQWPGPGRDRAPILVPWPVALHGEGGLTGRWKRGW